MITYQNTATAIGVGLALVILWLVRRDHLHGPFAIWWIGVAITVALLGFFTGLFDKLAHSLGITYPPILAVALLAYTPVPQVAPTLWGTRPAPAETKHAGIDWSMAQEAGESRAWRDEPKELRVESQTSVPVSASDPQLLTPSLHLPLLRLIGQIGATYLVAEGPDGLYLIDQHAAHERVLFEKLMAQHDMKSISSQALLSPAVITLPPQSANLLTSQLSTLNHFGFEVEEFGTNTFQVRAMPVLFGSSDP